MAPRRTAGFDVATPLAGSSDAIYRSSLRSYQPFCSTVDTVLLIVQAQGVVNSGGPDSPKDRWLTRGRRKSQGKIELRKS